MNNNKNTELPGLKLAKKGKVREIYDLGEFYLIVASDRISAFDVIMDNVIPDKGKILTEISAFWFKKTKHIIPNHLISTNPSEYPPETAIYAEDLKGRSMLVQKCKTLPIEFVVRGYITGSGWKDYKKTGKICGIELPENLLEFSKLPEPIFTPTTKAAIGHDEAIDFYQTIEILGADLAQQLKEVSIKLFTFASDYLESRGLILADTKFEFGLNNHGKPILIDEVFTPDSSRFWLKETYQPGKYQTNFDKQALRDYLDNCGWDKQYPPPVLPDYIIDISSQKYHQALDMIL